MTDNNDIAAQWHHVTVLYRDALTLLSGEASDCLTGEAADCGGSDQHHLVAILGKLAAHITHTAISLNHATTAEPAIVNQHIAYAFTSGLATLTKACDHDEHTDIDNFLDSLKTTGAIHNNTTKDTRA
jgi:hypothetical protein